MIFHLLTPWALTPSGAQRITTEYIKFIKILQDITRYKNITKYKKDYSGVTANVRAKIENEWCREN